MSTTERRLRNWRRTSMDAAQSTASRFSATRLTATRKALLTLSLAQRTLSKLHSPWMKPCSVAGKSKSCRREPTGQDFAQPTEDSAEISEVEADVGELVAATEVALEEKSCKLGLFTSCQRLLIYLFELFQRIPRTRQLLLTLLTRTRWVMSVRTASLLPTLRDDGSGRLPLIFFIQCLDETIFTDKRMKKMIDGRQKTLFTALIREVGKTD